MIQEWILGNYNKKIGILQNKEFIKLICKKIFVELIIKNRYSKICKGYANERKKNNLLC
jgi:hypothetical protein